MATYPITWPRNARRIIQTRRRSLEQHAALSEALACHRGELPRVRKSLERRVAAYHPVDIWAGGPGLEQLAVVSEYHVRTGLGRI